MSQPLAEQWVTAVAGFAFLVGGLIALVAGCIEWAEAQKRAGRMTGRDVGGWWGEAS